MDNKNGKLGAGRFYVISEKCINCDFCRDLAPDFFAHDDDGYSKIIKQPTSDAEVELCIEAMDSCPVSAIVDNCE